MTVKLLTEKHFELLSLKGGCTGSSEHTLVKMPHCWKSHVAAHYGMGLTCLCEGIQNLHVTFNSWSSPWFRNGERSHRHSYGITFSQCDRDVCKSLGLEVVKLGINWSKLCPVDSFLSLLLYSFGSWHHHVIL